MNKFLHTTDALEYIEYTGNREIIVFNLDELPRRKYSIEDVYTLFEGWARSITPNTATRIVLTSDTKSKVDCMNLFLTFNSILSKFITHDLKEGEKRLAPRTEIMANTSVDMVTMKRYLNNVCDIEYLQVELYRKGKSVATL